MNCKPHSAEMTGSIRYLSKEIYELYKDEITHICEGFAKSLKCKVNVEIFEEYPPVINHEKSTTLVKSVGVNLVGQESCF